MPWLPFLWVTPAHAWGVCSCGETVAGEKSVLPTCRLTGLGLMVTAASRCPRCTLHAAEGLSPQGFCSASSSCLLPHILSLPGEIRCSDVRARRWPTHPCATGSSPVPCPWPAEGHRGGEPFLSTCVVRPQVSLGLASLEGSHRLSQVFSCGDAWLPCYHGSSSLQLVPPAP